MSRDEILESIRRIAAQNGGIAPGKQRFERETGIRESEWSGRFWARWSDAVQEAGLSVNKLQGAYHDDDILAPLAALVRELGRFPVATELRMRRRSDAGFPSHNTFNRFGARADLARRLAAHCLTRDGLDDVVRICEAVANADVPILEEVAGPAPPIGVVYLMKSGRHYKIGRTAAIGRRTYELAIQLPERLELVHVIETDDPVGIERYWHERFSDRRANGEWFNLTRSDVAAFRRRKKFM